MKNADQITKRIEIHEQQIGGLKENASDAMAKISEKIIKYATDPGYIAKWLDTWMSDVNYFNAQIAEHYKAIKILHWTLED